MSGDSFGTQGSPTVPTSLLFAANLSVKALARCAML